MAWWLKPGGERGEFVRLCVLGAGDAHGGAKLASMGREGVELAILEASDVLDMVGLVRLPQQQGTGPVRVLACSGKK